MNRIVVGLALSVALLGGGCFYLFHLLRFEQQQVATLRTQVNDLRQANLSLSGPDGAPAGNDLRNDAVPDPTAEAAAPADAGGAGEASGSKRNDRVLPAPSNERYRNARHRLQRLLIEQDNPELVRVLALSPEHADRFLDLLAEGAIREQQAYSEKNVGTEQRRQAQQARTELESQVAALLGNGKLEQWKQYESSRAARDLVSQLRTAMATTGDPLRDDQAESMIASMTAERQRDQAGRMNLYNEGPATWVDDATSADRLAHMRRRQDAINEHLDRLQDIGRTYLDAEQQQHFDAMLKRSRDYSQAQFDLWLAGEKAPSR